MKDLHDVLNDADPLRFEPPMSELQVRNMRRAVLSGIARPEAVLRFWPGALPVAILVAIMIAVGAAAGRRLEPSAPVATKAVSLEPGAPTERTQVQFATPGGTRIIWTLDPQFELGVMP